ncbi:undecaprenyldiphospho-muramoylpentapeptide beta-N-acetylglucosaminyltransferase [Leptolyngbya sp. FACHB-261]|nr:undecaprenyldiphospho-muramoylpentapeptide beta-N-acetylglucosaminyltransferase [Leptolyngbya sp. FACHB-261]
MGSTAPRLLIAASGTGGHLFPALAVAEQLAPDFAIEWLGVPDRLEVDLVAGHYPLHKLNMGGFQSRSPVAQAKTLVLAARAVLQTRRLLQQGKFCGVFTTGGYIAAPSVLAARWLGLPAVFHESNAIPGKVTRWLGPWCTVMALGFKEAESYLPRTQTRTVGTPVRSDFNRLIAAGSERTAEGPVILVVGGSQGAVALNQLVRACAPAWLEAGARIIHQTGASDPDVAQAPVHPHYQQQPFYDNMPSLMRDADLVVSRSGAGTLTELALCGLPSVLIPFPFAADDHQTYNAQVFEAAGAALLFQQTDLTPEKLQRVVLDLLADPAKRQYMGKQALGLAVPDSAQQVAQLLREVISSAKVFQK